jgi:hypothetical protein
MDTAINTNTILSIVATNEMIKGRIVSEILRRSKLLDNRRSNFLSNLNPIHKTKMAANTLGAKEITLFMINSV